MARIITIFCLTVICAFLSAASCNKQTAAESPCKDVMCTMLFASVSVTVQDAAGKAVLLDSTTTTRQNGDPVYHGGANGNGVYPVLDDNYQKTLANRSEQFTFSGYIGGKKIAEAGFIIAADCCHISRAGGPATITVQ